MKHKEQLPQGNVQVPRGPGLGHLRQAPGISCAEDPQRPPPVVTFHSPWLYGFRTLDPARVRPRGPHMFGLVFKKLQRERTSSKGPEVMDGGRERGRGENPLPLQLHNTCKGFEDKDLKQ